MKATEKSPVLEQSLNQLLGVSRSMYINNDTCVICRQPATEFKDEISKREFGISGLCQSCQDSVFDDGV